MCLTQFAKLIKRWPLSYKARIWEMAVHWSRIYEIERRNESEAKRTEKQGRRNKPNEATALLEEEIDIVFEKKVLGTSSPQSLLKTVWLNNILPKSSVQGQQNDCNWLNAQAMGVNILNSILKDLCEPGGNIPPNTNHTGRKTQCKSYRIMTFNQIR